MKKIILDTSFILTALKQKINLASELQRILDKKFTIHIIDKTLKELENKKHEKLAIQILKSLKCSIIKTTENKNVDNLILDHIKKHPSCIVATQDKSLKEKLKKRNIRLITIRQKKYLKFVS